MTDPAAEGAPDGERAFRPELEGLRAVAVGLVLLFHAGIPGWSGGYVGVDVFFVLSGFLITGLLLRELGATGHIDLPQFYARRARRLLPAAAVALVGTLVLAAILLPPLQMPDVAADIAAAALYVSNMRFALLATDYLGSAGPPSPVLHFWSLGVEEQFYVFWPALVLGAALLARRLGRGLSSGRRVVGVPATIPITAVVVIVLAASLAGSIALTSFAQPWAFFTLPARAWELALGGLLALGARRTTNLPAAVGGALVAIGLGLIVAAGIVLDETTPFPGTAALLPTVGAGLVIAGGQAGAATLPARVLQLGPMRYLGRISYSLYLWHWPLLVLPAEAAGRYLSIEERIGLAGLSVIVAAMSQRWIEDPIRRGRFVGRNVRRSLALALTTSLVVAATAFGTSTLVVGRLPSATTAQAEVPASFLPDPLASILAAPGNGVPEPTLPGASLAPAVRPALAAAAVPRDLEPPLLDAKAALPRIYPDGCHLELLETKTPDHCVYGDPNATTTIVLFGDSHAAQWFPALDTIATLEHWRLLPFTKSACGPVDAVFWNTRYGRPYTECSDWHEAVYDEIGAIHPAFVVASTSHIGYQIVDGDQRPSARSRPDLWDAGYRRMVARLTASADHVVIIGDTPRSDVDPPVCLSAHLDDASACATPVDDAVDLDQLQHEEQMAVAGGADFIDPQLWICPTSPCPAIIDAYLVFRDESHMTPEFSTALASRLLAALPRP